MMIGWDFEVSAWLKFWRWNLIKICVWTCLNFGKQNSTLRSVVPLGMFSFNLLNSFLKEERDIRIMIFQNVLHLKWRTVMQRSCEILDWEQMGFPLFNQNEHSGFGLVRNIISFFVAFWQLLNHLKWRMYLKIHCIYRTNCRGGPVEHHWWLNV